MRYMPQENDPVSLQEQLEDRDRILQQLKGNLEKAQVHMKNHADKKRRDVELQVGDSVLVRLQPYRQQSVALRKNQKLGMRFFGPFMITARVGAVAYKLQLPQEAKIHSVFHVSQLKPFKGGTTEQYMPLPLTMTEMGPIIPPTKVLATRVVQQGELKIPQVLIQWANLSAEEAIWEELEDMKVNYPNLNLEDKVVLNGDGIVMRQNEGNAESALMDPQGRQGNEFVMHYPHNQGLRRSTRVSKDNNQAPDYLYYK
jgi:hypothetical protein